MIENYDFLSIAINLYRNGKISTGKAAEIANLSVYEFTIECAKRRIPIQIGLESIKQLAEEKQILKI